MKNLRTKSLFIALIALIAASGLFIVNRVKASPTAVERRQFFGIQGITRGQTARLNVVNVSSADDPLYPPDPCHVTMWFVDADGNQLLNIAGQPVRRDLTLEPGHTAFLQINGDNLIPRDQVRLTFRPVVSVTPPDPNIPPDPCIPTLEVINNTTGHTSLLVNGTSLTPAQTSPTGQ
jgi:hypothetical protein